MDEFEREVRGLLDQYVGAVQRRGLSAYGEVVAHDASMVNFGAFGGPLVGYALRQTMEGQNAALDSMRIEQSDVSIHALPSDNQAWATSLWRFRARSGEREMDLPVVAAGSWCGAPDGGGWSISTRPWLRAEPDCSTGRLCRWRPGVLRRFGRHCIYSDTDTHPAGRPSGHATRATPSRTPTDDATGRFSDPVHERRGGLPCAPAFLRSSWPSSRGRG